MNSIIPFVHEGLGNSSYVVGLGDGEAFVVDPDRNVKRYREAAAARGWQIRRIFETHLHADFVSGSLELASATSAEVFAPAEGQASFRHRSLAAGERVQLGQATIEAVASPGHTPEHLSYVLNWRDEPAALFSGGSLIAGGAARTDLISPQMTEPLTRAQFHSIRTAFAGLANETLLLPTHGGGSFCSAGVGDARTSTLGRERATNPLLAVEDESTFARWFPTTFPAVPAYFYRLRAVNQSGPKLASAIRVPRLLTPQAFHGSRPAAVVIDVRPQSDFIRGHVPGSISNTLRDQFPIWLGWLVPENASLLFVRGSEPLDEIVQACLLVGYEAFAGVLEGGMAAWEQAGFASASAQLADSVAARELLRGGAVALDVREPSEFAAGHIPGAVNVPLGSLIGRESEVPLERPILTYCGHGERSATALSLLKAAGFHLLINLDGGFGGWEESGAPIDKGDGLG